MDTISALAYRWNQPSRPMLNTYHFFKRFSSEDPSFGVDGYELRESSIAVPSRGTLGKLPVEILHGIFLSLDPFTLEMVRELSSYYKQVLDNLSAYRLLKTHAKETLRIMHLTNMSYWSLRQIFAEFCRPLCRPCDQFGPFIFLPTYSRCCYSCLLNHQDYRLIRVSDLMTWLLIPRHIIDHFIPIVHTLSNDYGTYNYYTHDESQELVSFQEGCDLAHRLHGTVERITELRAKRDAKERARYIYELKAMEEWHEIRAWGDYPPPVEPIRPECLKVRLYNDETLLRWRFMGSTAFPYWNIEKQKLETGTYCSACTAKWEGVPHVDPKWDSEQKKYHQAFLVEDMPDHFRQCEATKMVVPRLDSVHERFPLKRSGKNF